MNKQLTKKTIGIAASAALMASVAFSSSALAGKPDRNPSEKDCPNITQETRCGAELDAAYLLVDQLSGQVPAVFLSRNADKDAGSLKCKISGAKIKLSQDYKEDEASGIMQQALDKIWSLWAQGKLSDDGLAMMEASFNTAKGCIDSL
jgi:hypothetical protein